MAGTSVKVGINSGPLQFGGISKTSLAIGFCLKGHGNETDFLGFLQKLVPHESLTLPFRPFGFWLRIHGDIRIRKMTPRYHRYGESPTLRIGDTGSRRLPVLLSRGVDDSQHH
jgi:hypothetical protein